MTIDETQLASESASSQSSEESSQTKRIAEIELAMMQVDFWQDKDKAQALIKELQDLKTLAEAGPGAGPYDAGGAIVTIFSGAGGDDAEDFSHMLFEMYSK